MPPSQPKPESHPVVFRKGYADQYNLLYSGKDFEAEYERYLVAERIAMQGLYLPSGLTLTEQQINYVCEVVKGLLS